MLTNESIFCIIAFIISIFSQFFDKSQKLINVLAGIRKYWWEYFSKINQRTSTTIPDSRVGSYLLKYLRIYVVYTKFNKALLALFVHCQRDPSWEVGCLLITSLIISVQKGQDFSFFFSVFMSRFSSYSKVFWAFLAAERVSRNSRNWYKKIYFPYDFLSFQKKNLTVIITYYTSSFV